MAKIEINCGNCGESKGCKIKKQFREFVKTFPERKYEESWGNDYIHHGIHSDIFELKCPIKTPAYTNGQSVIFTVAYGAREIIKLWDCDFTDEHGESCNGCKNSEICNDGVVEFKNIRYFGNVEIKGIILNYSKRDLFVIQVELKEFDRVKDKFNEIDLKRLKAIDGSIIENGTTNDLDWMDAKQTKKHFYFVSKAKFIKSVNK